MRIWRAIFGIVCFIGLLSPLTAPSPASAVTSQGRTIYPNQGWYANGSVLWMGNDGNLVMYHTNTGSWVAQWWTGPKGANAWANLQDDGNVVIYSSGGSVLWQNGSGGNPGSTHVHSVDGNYSVFSPNSVQLFTSNTSRTPAGGTSVSGAAPFGVGTGSTGYYADSSTHIWNTIESNTSQKNAYLSRFRGPGGENVYEPTDLTFSETSSTSSTVDVLWWVSTPSNPAAAAEAWCDNPSSSTVCNQFRIRIDPDSISGLSSHMNNNLVAHELGHTIGFGHGTDGSTTMSSGDNAKLGWWMIDSINARW